MPTTKESVLEIHSDLVLKGRLSMVKDIVLTGKFEGELQTQGCLTVSAGGVALGTIEAGSLVLEPGNQVEARVKIGSTTRAFIHDEPAKKASSRWPLRLKNWKRVLTSFRL